jgi:hypothetical protein
MSPTISDSNDINTVLQWAMGRTTAYPGGPALTDEDATAAGRRLAERAYKALYVGLRPDQVRLTRSVSEASLAGDPACRVCGCTENKPCLGGCCWVEDPKMLGELCSSCAIFLKQAELL